MSGSERELFGGPLVYDTSWTRHEAQRYRMGLGAMVSGMPRLIGKAATLAWRAGRSSTLAVVGAELGRGVCQAVGLMGVNALLASVLADGHITDRLAAAFPVLGVLAGAAALGAGLGAVSTVLSGPLKPRVERLARERYLERAYQVEMEAMEDENFHRLLQSAEYGALSAGRMIEGALSVLASLVSLLTAAGVLGALHPALLPMLLVAVVPRALATLLVARHRYRSFHRWVQHTRASGVLVDVLTSTEAAQEIRVHGVGPYLLRHFRGMSQSQEREQARLARVTARTDLVAGTFSGVATAAAYALLFALLWTGRMELAAAGTAFLALRTGTGQLAGLVGQVNTLHEEALYVADLDRLLAESAGRRIPAGGRSVPSGPREVTLENVTFHYPGSDGAPALRDVSLTVPLSGGVIALVGENGSGKSTLAKLLAALYLPETGTVRWDGMDVRDLDRQDIFRQFSIVHQDHFRWPLTARANATIADTSSPMCEGRLARAAAHAGVDRIVPTLPRGWDTLLSRSFQGGHQLSGGQWQKLGIARAHYRDAPVLIVDEPTAALDARAEQRVFDQIRSLADAGRTIVLITHRMASVRHADHVHVLHHGALVESGSPERLLALPDGHYRALYDTQAAQFQAIPSPRGTAADQGGCGRV
ncbi:ABC transporter ATP-binding protein [Streptomyces sp. enrichment culture]|uniref:ABC transporter ATP-binding protein n=1 Tax=Streptomyces sp. enrichment culture TaxID=1795815 RepID=UPI003F580195